MIISLGKLDLRWGLSPKWNIGFDLQKKCFFQWLWSRRRKRFVSYIRGDINMILNFVLVSSCNIIDIISLIAKNCFSLHRFAVNPPDLHAVVI